MMTTTVATQEIRVGREIILKTEYLEFDPAIVTAVEIEPIYQNWETEPFAARKRERHGPRAMPLFCRRARTVDAREC